MNRSAKENLVVPITSAFQMQVREPYLIFRMDKKSNGNSNNDKKSNDDKNANQKIRGIWFHDSEERTAISSTLDRIVKTVATYIDDEDDIKVDNNNVAKRMSSSEATATLLSALNINRGETATKNNNDDQSNGQDQQGEKELLHNIELDKKSLQLSLMALLQDERFIDLIHAQYVKVVRARKK